MNSKQECIAKAYGEYWEELKDCVDENGWHNIHKGKIKFEDYYYVQEFENKGNYYRPKSLQGIENNNSWLKIESEDDLPKDYNSLYDVSNNQNVNSVPMTLHQVKYLYNNNKITHYQKHEKKTPPLH